MASFAATENATVHRTAYKLGVAATQQFEDARTFISQWIGSASSKQIVFTKGATEALNLIAHGLVTTDCLNGSEILICATEHHANLLPWQRFAAARNMTIRVMPVDKGGRLEVDQALGMINANTALIAMAHVSNALGNCYPIETFITKAKQHDCLSVIDGTQAVAHMPVDVESLGCDFYVFSGHKMFGPNGVGVLYGRFALLDVMQAYQVGGEMVKHADFHNATFMPPPIKFEAGTPNVPGVIALGRAATYIQQHQTSFIEHERQLAEQLFGSLSKIHGLKMYGDFAVGKSTLPIVSLNVAGIHHHDLALMLDAHGVAVRSGHHCAMPLMHHLGLDGTLRISLSVYNTLADIEVLVSAILACIEQAKQHPETTPKANVVAHNEASSESLPLAAAIQAAKGWDNVYRQLMLAGKHMPVLDEAQRTAENQVEGCEAAVWLGAMATDTQSRQFIAYSPSKIVRGLLAVILEKANSLEKTQQSQFDYLDYLHNIGLHRFLSESRQNGTRAVVERVKSY